MTDTVSLETCMAAACAAYRINGKYVRRDAATEEFPANNWLMATILNEKPQDITEEDLVNSRRIITYLEHKLPELIAETLQDYWRNAVLLTEQAEISLSNFKSFAFIASVPSSVYNACQREQVAEELRIFSRGSRTIGKVGDNFPACNVKILGSVYSRNYFKHYHTAITTEGNLLRFPMSDQLTTDQEYVISGRIHKHDDRNTTILHYVRVKKTVDKK